MDYKKNIMDIFVSVFIIYKRYEDKYSKVICTFMINQISCHTSMQKMTFINSTIN